ncbi:MAG: hypothetical protein M3Y87_03315 [Myxococcota bacterium]|nr:hypothetical protein [Myxococcota bacterium]
MRALRLSLSLSLALATTTSVVLAQDVEIPAHNRAELTEAPPRPGRGDVDERARRLLDAIVANDPARAADFFLPREAFRAIKGISDPDALYDRIVRMYADDIAALHASLGPDAARAELVRFEFSRRRGWVRVREESNRLPYWAQRHNWLVYRVGTEERRIEVRTMIAWDDRWYITHLSEFR